MSNQSNSNNTISATESSQEEQNITREQTAANESDNSSSSSEGIPIIADKAKCKCAGANDPNALVGINVLSQSKILVNEGSVLAATTNDKTVASLNFGTCKITRSTCNANIEWQNAYADTQILGSLQILTMNSFGMCSIGGKVEFATCGQSERITPASTKDIIGIEMQQMSEENTTASAEEVLSEINSDLGVDPLADSMNAVLNQIEDVVIETLEAGAGDSKAITSITPITYPQSKTGGTVKQPKNVLCTFKGAASGTYHWKIRNESMSVLKEAEGAGQITIRFPKVGRYVIEAYQTRSYVKDNTTIAQIDTRSGDFKNALIINVVENELTLNANKTKCPINDTVNIKVEKLFDTIDIDAGQISYQVLSQGIPLADTTKAEVTGNHQAATAKFKASGSYVVQGTSSRGLKINSTESITIDALSVKNVTANNESKYTARKGENFELKAQLNYDTPENQQRVKWEVYYSETENGTKTKCHPIVGGAILNNKPPVTLFTQVGFYFVYAFCATTKTESVKTVVNICQPQFVSVQWQDLNGNNIKELGKREEVYANIVMEGVNGLSLKFEVYCLQTNKLIEDMSIAQMQSNKAIYKLKLSDNAISELKEGDKLYIKPSIRNNNNVNIVNKDKAPSDFWITYVTKKSITSIGIYSDRDCRQTLSVGTVGDTIYARVLTRNLEETNLNLGMFRKLDNYLNVSELVLFIDNQKIQEDGSVVFTIITKQNWQTSKENYLVYAVETNETTPEYSSIWRLFYSNRASAKLKINQNISFLTLTNNSTNAVGQNKTITTVNQVTINRNENNNCVCEERIRAFMRMLRVGEGSGEIVLVENNKRIYKAQDPEKQYKRRYGKDKYFEDLSTHPDRVWPGGSSAAGAYQIMRYTWWTLKGNEVLQDKDGNYYKTGNYIESLDCVKKYKIPDYSAESQDKLCLIIMKDYRSGILSLIQQGKIKEAIKKYGCREWASLPCNDGNESYYMMPDKSKKQPATPMSECMDHYDQFYQQELKGKTCLHIKNFINEAIFSIKCRCGVVKKEEPVKSTNSKWHDPVDNPCCTIYMQNGAGKEIGGDRWGLFGKVRGGDYHAGLDLFAEPGTSIYACVDAYVDQCLWMGGYGNSLVLKVKDKKAFLKYKKDYKLKFESLGEKNNDSGYNEDGDIYLFYAHLKSVNDFYKDEEVIAGTILGETGVSGVKNKRTKDYGTMAPHLHFEIYTLVSGNKKRIHPGFFVKFKHYTEQSETEKKKQTDKKNEPIFTSGYKGDGQVKGLSKK